MIDAQILADRVHMALMEAGRPDLAELVIVFENDDGTPYVELLDECEPDEVALIDRAEHLAVTR